MSAAGPRCPSKMRWATKGDAAIFIRDLKRQRKMVGTLRPYWCKACDGWHLTSQSKSESRRRRRRAAHQ